MNGQAKAFPLLRLPSLVHQEIVNMFDPTSVINCLLTSKRMSNVIMLHIQKPTDMDLTLTTFGLVLTQDSSEEHHHWKFMESTVENVTTEITKCAFGPSVTTTIHCENPEDSLKKWAELAIKVFRTPISEIWANRDRMANFGVGMMNWLQTIQQVERHLSYAIEHEEGEKFEVIDFDRVFMDPKSLEWTPEFKKVLDSRVV